MSDVATQNAKDEALAIKMVGVSKWYGAFQVLKNVNLDVKRGEKIVICGPSGSGKSTTIRCINRLEEHQQGDIIVDGIPLTNDLKRVDEIRREVGMGVPALQPVSASDHSGKLHAGTDLGAQDAQEGCGRNRDEISHARAHSRSGQQISRASSPAASSSAWRLRARSA